MYLLYQVGGNGDRGQFKKGWNKILEMVLLEAIKWQGPDMFESFKPLQARRQNPHRSILKIFDQNVYDINFLRAGFLRIIK